MAQTSPSIASPIFGSSTAALPPSSSTSTVEQAPLRAPSAMLSSRELDVQQSSNVKPTNGTYSNGIHNAAKPASREGMKPANSQQLDLLPFTETRRSAAPASRQPKKEFPFARLDIESIPEHLTVAWPDLSAHEPYEADMRTVRENLRRESEISRPQPTPMPSFGEPSATFGASGAGGVQEIGFATPSPIETSALNREIHAIADSDIDAFSEPAPLDTPVVIRHASDTSVEARYPSELSFDTPSPREGAPAIGTSSVVAFPKRETRARTPVTLSTFVPGKLFRRGEPKAEETIGSEETIDSAWPLHTFRKFTPVGIAVSLPILLCLLFWSWSNRIERNASPLASLFLSAPETHPQIAPDGIDLADLKSELITLDGGTQVLQISGSVVNNTNSTFKTVNIEAKSYDQENRVLERAVTNSNNGLITTQKLAHLKEDALETLQDKPGIIGFQLKPNSELPFKVILNTPADKTAWFSARVYSVQAAGITS